MNIMHEGSLRKWTNYIYGWKMRYFVLHDGLLEYCKEKGKTLKGKMSLSTLDVKKHPKKDSELIINTGTSTMSLRAQNPKEAQEWFVALKRALAMEMSHSLSISSASFRRGSIESLAHSLPKDLAFKVGELWSVHALISESVDSIPASMRERCPELEKILSLCNTFKMVASETLSLIEEEEPRPAAPQRHTLNPQPRMSIDASEASSVRSQQPRGKKGTPRGAEAEEEEEEGPEKSEESIQFEDAHSHYSEEEQSVPHRNNLPYLRNPNQKINIWKVVKDSVGKELSKIAVPVYFNEPISFLQRFTEDLTYNEVILNASELEDPCLRLAYVACFGVTSYVSSAQRTMKPFNPLLGETYELVRDGYRVISEQVSHHPPISALHCQHSKFLFSASVDIKTSFKGTHLNVIPRGKNHLILKEFGDHFVWEKPQTNVHNIIFGKMYVDHYGKMEFVNTTTGDKAMLNFHKKGWFEKASHEVNGVISDRNGIQRYRVMGQWNNYMSVQDLSTNKITKVWEKYPYPENYDHNYFFSEFAIQLNIPGESYPGLPITDSRFRPDQRALENGDIKLAGSEKNRLEEKQRLVRKIREESGEEHMPRWFYPNGGEWEYAGGYWECREANNFQNLPNIF